MTEPITLCAIVAMAENRAIGKGNKLLWHISEDLKHFKRATMGKPLIMGRKTFESLPGILPGRSHVVISRSGALSYASQTHDDVHHVVSIEDSIQLAKNIAQDSGQKEVFITGGGEIYRQAMAMIDRLYLTLVHQNYDGDTFFPEIDWEDWIVQTEKRYDGSPSFTVYVMDRKR